MATIPVEAQITTEQLIHALERLPSQEFATVIDHLLALRAQRQGSHLSESETALLLQINQGIDPPSARRLNELVAKRQDETITPDELHELIALTDQVEHHDTQRLAALDALARLRRVPLAELMASLGMAPPTDA